MNWTDEEIDKLFQESASQMNVPYQDAFWTEMEALLPEKEKKKGFGWIFGGTLTCFVLIAAIIFPINQFSVQPSKSKLAKHNAIQAPAKMLVNNTENANSEQNIQQQADAGSGEEQLYRNTGRNLKTDFVNPESTFAASPVADILSDAAPKNAEPVAEIVENELLAVENKVPAAEENEAKRLPLLNLSYDAPQLAQNSYGTFRPAAKKNQYYVQLGLGMSQSYVSGTDKNWMPSVNLGAGYQFRPQGFGFSAGVNFSGSFANNLEITRRSKVYNFGSTDYEQDFSYKQLYSIELPVSVDFRKGRHVLSLGIAPTYLLTTVMHFSQYENQKVSENQNYTGQKVGLNSFGLKPSIAYQLELAKSWHLGIQLSTQVIRQIDETQFVGNLTRLPLSGQITIRKTLLR